MAQLMPVPFPTFLDANGDPLSGGQLFSYAAGTTTPLATYTDASGGTPNTNPVILNSDGEASIWLGPSAYKFVLQDSLSNVIWTVDNVSIIEDGSITSGKIAAQAVQTSNIAAQAVGTAQLATAAVTGPIIAEGVVTNDKLANLIEVVLKNVRDLTCPGLIQTIPQYEWSNPSLLYNPATAPPGTVTKAKWSPNGEFLAVASGLSPYIDIYQMTAGALVKIANPGTLPTGAVFDITWSPCGDFLACAHRTSPYVTIYQRSGNSFIKLSNPASIPNPGTNVVVSAYLSFSPNSDFLIGSWFAPIVGLMLIVWERSGTTFTDITTASAISGASNMFRWSPDSSVLTCTNNAGVIVAFARTDSVFSSVTAPSVTSYVGDITDFAFSPDGNFFAVAVSISPYVLIFQVSGNTYTQLPNPATLPAGSANCISWSENTEYLMVGHNTTPFMTIYSISGTTFTKIADPTTVPAAAVVASSWSHTKQYLAVGSGTSPYIQVYETASSLAASGIFWVREPNV